MIIGVRANIHLGVKESFARMANATWVQPTRFGGGGSSRIFSVNCNNRPDIPVNQTCIVFCPNNLDSLPELMSTNCPDWGGN